MSEDQILGGPVGEDRGPYPPLNPSPPRRRSFVIAIPDLEFCEAAEAEDYRGAVELMRVSGYLDQQIEEFGRGAPGGWLFDQPPLVYIIDTSSRTTAVLGMQLRVGFVDGDQFDGVLPNPPPGARVVPGPLTDVLRADEDETDHG